MANTVIQGWREDLPDGCTPVVDASLTETGSQQVSKVEKGEGS